MADRKKKKPASLGCLFWIAVILLIIVLFFLKKDVIMGILQKTGAIDLLTGKKTEQTLTDPTKKQEEPALKTIEKPIAKTDLKEIEGDGSAETKPPSPEKPATENTKSTTTKKPETTTTKPATKTQEKTVTPATKPVTPKQEPVKDTSTRKATLFFVTIDSDGRVLRKEVVREIALTDSPLSEALLTLFKGTNGTESGKGLRSLIPQNTRLISAIVKDGTATLNLSDEFQFNQFGIEGYLGQLSQIVFTATAFPTVKSVQFLIEGQRQEYLGAEGVWIGTPLSRDKF